MTGARQPLGARRLLLWLALLAGLLAISIVLGASLGAGRVSLLRLLPWNGASEIERRILLEVRVPRVLLSAVIGGALTVAGVVFQALLRNPLADPYVLGVSGGASIGRVAALLIGFGGSGALLGGWGIHFMSFVGALGALMLIEWIATVNGRLTIYTILLTGAIFNAFSASLIYFVQSVASLEQLHAIVFSLMGQVPSFGLAGVGLICAAVVAATLVLFTMARDYNALSLGEEGAQQLGIDVDRVKRVTFVVGSLLTGLAVSVAGLIGFVGLVVPHMLRLTLGPDHRLLLPAAFLGGASFMVVADLVARLVIAPNELPVGVVTALVGGPFFLYLLRRRSGSHAFI